MSLAKKGKPISEETKLKRNTIPHKATENQKALSSKRMKEALTGTKYITDGTKSLRVKINENYILPEGWKFGRTGGKRGINKK